MPWNPRKPPIQVLLNPFPTYLYTVTPREQQLSDQSETGGGSTGLWVPLETKATMRTTTRIVVTLTNRVLASQEGGQR